MPKIIDHDAYKEELASRAAALFSEHGYSGLGMRAIAQALGVSKSALYHYFPTKKDLFVACTRVAADLPAPAPGTDDPVDQLVGLAQALRPGFAGEMSLLFDYLRGMSPEEIAADPAMRLALERFETAIAEIAGPAQGREVLALLMGGLFLDYFSGGAWPVDALRGALARLARDGNAAPANR